MKNYVPPFELTNDILEKISSIMEKIGKLDNYNAFDKNPYLRKQTRINSMHSSLAIENNKLSLNQVKNVINGKVVIGKVYLNTFQLSQKFINIKMNIIKQ